MPVELTLRSSAEDDFQLALDRTAASLISGQVALVPTDTVYGLACSPASPSAVLRIYSLKQRPADLRLPVIVSGLEQGLEQLPLVWNADARSLAKKFWPGPLTIACAVHPDASGWMAGRSEAGVRAPKHAFLNALADRIGPFLMTSANRSGMPTPSTAAAAAAALAERPDLIVDAGPLVGVSSTLVNTNLPATTVERNGPVSAAQITEALSAGR